MNKGDRARVQLPDVMVMLIVTVSAVATGPIYYDFAAQIASDSGPLTALLLELVVPFIMIGIVISVGVSGVRDLRGGQQ